MSQQPPNDSASSLVDDLSSIRDWLDKHSDLLDPDGARRSVLTKTIDALQTELDAFRRLALRYGHDSPVLMAVQLLELEQELAKARQHQSPRDASGRSAPVLPIERESRLWQLVSTLQHPGGVAGALRAYGQMAHHDHAQVIADLIDAAASSDPSGRGPSSQVPASHCHRAATNHNGGRT